MSERLEWCLLAYRIPREPSTPRIAVWRQLKRLGVAQIGDGLVALPLDARTREQLEWVADAVRDAGGEATIWLSKAASAAQEQAVARAMATGRAAEYRAVRDQAGAPEASRRDLRRLRRELQRITRRDYFPLTEREDARAAVDRLAARLAAAGAARP
jgi:hypothetical protein